MVQFLKVDYVPYVPVGFLPKHLAPSQVPYQAPPLKLWEYINTDKKKEQMNKNRSKRESPFFLSRDEEKDSTQITP